MSKSLKSVQTCYKIAHVISIIVLVFCIIGAVGCVIGAICFAVLGNLSVNFGEIKFLFGTIEKETDMSVQTLYTVLLCGFIVSVGETVYAKLTETYFRHELAQGTPFTPEGVKEVRRLGIIGIALPIGLSIIVSVIQSVLSTLLESVVETDIGAFSIGLGVVFLILSFIFNYGTELKAEAENHVEI